MAILRTASGASYVALAAHCLVGRSLACTLRLDAPEVSGEHARLAFLGGAWHVRDLGSRNGTFVNGARVDPGAPRPLAVGDALGFGAPAAAFTLADASPPVAMARRLATDAMIAAQDGLLALPSADAPAACVFEGEPGAWIVEIDGQPRPARDGEVLTLAGEAFMLHLPVAEVSTADVGARRLTLADVEIGLRVSRDEERVEVTLSGAGGARVIESRVHHYTLLTLARARLRDRDAAGLVEAQRGWMNVEALCRALAMDEMRLNVEIYRIRKDFAALGVADAAAVIERRRTSRQLRLGTARLTVTTMT